MRGIIFLLIIISISTNHVMGFNAFKTGIGNVVSAGGNIGRAVGEGIPKIIPSPAEIFDGGKQALLGYPFAALAEAINQFCSLAVSGNGTIPKVTPNASAMSFILFTGSDNITIPVLEPEQIHKHLNRDHNFTLFITGWTTDLSEQDTTVDTMYKAYQARGNTNFLVLDSARFVDTLYTWSAFNTEDIGYYVGIALSKLINIIPLSKIHVIGHSLGAHIAGSAARTFWSETKKLLPRVTGLDPANPCFNEGELLTGLQRGDADFIDIYHTNNGVLGQRSPLGDVDCYPNGVTPLQPGCFTVTCAHARAWELFAETVYPGNENNFLAVRCNSLTSVNTGKCPGDKVPIGINIPRNIKGNYFFETKSESPFGN